MIALVRDSDDVMLSVVMRDCHVVMHDSNTTTINQVIDTYMIGIALA